MITSTGMLIGGGLGGYLGGVGGLLGGMAVGGGAGALADTLRERRERQREERVERGRGERERRRGRARELLEHGIPQRQEHRERPVHHVAYNPDGTPALAEPIGHHAYGHHGTVPSEWHPVDITGFHHKEVARQHLGRTRRHAQMRDLLARTFDGELGEAVIMNPLHRS